MTVLLLILVIVLFVVFDRLSKRIRRLERMVGNLAAGSEASRPDPAPSPASPRDAPIWIEPPLEPPDAAPSSPPLQDTPSQPAAVDDDEDSLHDLELPDEPQPPPAPVTETPSREAPVHVAKASPWTERWQRFVDNVDWEQFTGVKLFAWLGGLALFIAAGFFVKFSIDRNLIPPTVRLAIGALTGLALVVASGRFTAHKYAVMRHTLAAGGIGVLYSVVFAATLYYNYLSKPLGFGLLALVSAAAFVLAVYHRGLAISVLGALGAYATPLLVNTGQGNIVMLFIYLAIVNVGLHQVVQRLTSQGLLLMAVVGTQTVLGLASWAMFGQTPPMVIAAVWMGNLALFAAFLYRSDISPRDNAATLWCGRVLCFGTLAMAAALLQHPGWPPLLLVIGVQTGALGLAWRHRAWQDLTISISALSFLVALAWVGWRFDASQFSIGFVLIFVYSVMGGLGPVLMVWKYGLAKSQLNWFRVFPVAMVLVGLGIVFHQPVISIWFWPLWLGMGLLGVGLSLIFGAFLQVALLVLLILIGGLNWIFQVPSEAIGTGFFVFMLMAGAGLSAGVFMMIRKRSFWSQALKLDAGGMGPTIPQVHAPWIQQGLAAAPAAAVSLLLAATFMIDYPLYPHPGMVTLVLFLFLVMFAAHRLRFQTVGVAALIAMAGAQAVFVFRPAVVAGIDLDACVWSGALFLAALAAPFLCFAALGQWKRIWQAWAVFEVSQAVFVLYAAQTALPPLAAHWAPLALALCKLPLVALLLRRLDGQPERNSILAFHGGVLLFYLSALPVLVLDHGWIGLTFIFEATALLWLNRRIEHPGLRWAALGLAPSGLVILLVNLPVLKSLDSLPLLNPATLSVAAGIISLAAAVTLAGHPQRRLRNMDLPVVFQWLTVATGFVLVNLAIADIFAGPLMRFRVWPEENFLQSACYALSWVALGGLLRRLTHLPAVMRKVGLGLVLAGAAWLIGLPLILPRAVGDMAPVINTALAAYLPLLAMLYYLFHKEPGEEGNRRLKNILLGFFLTAGFLALKTASSTFFQTGAPFALFIAHSPAKAVASAAGWIAYGLGLHIWPRPLDRPFRLAGMAMIVIGLLKALSMPFRFKVAFAAMPPLMNAPTLVFLFCLGVLVYLTMRSWKQNWPLEGIAPRVFWGIALALTAFGVLNIEIASAFAIQGRPFSMLTHGSLSMQLAYSIGWLLFAIGLLAVGIRWNAVQVRWAAIIAIVITASKIFVRDLWSLGQLYRVGSLFGLAVVLILVSFLYQRFLIEGKRNAE